MHHVYSSCIHSLKSLWHHDIGKEHILPQITLQPAQPELWDGQEGLLASGFICGFGKPEGSQHCVSRHLLPPLPWKQMLIFDTILSLVLRSIYVYFRCREPSLLPAGPTLCCNMRASHCDGFSCCEAIGSRCLCSVVLAHGLSCSVACGILWDQGSTCVLCVARQILNH